MRLNISKRYLAVEVFMIPAKTFGSIPNFTPNDKASEVPIIEIARAKLLHNLATSPEPASPQ